MPAQIAVPVLLAFEESWPRDVPGAELTGHGVTRSDDQDLWFIAVRYDDAGTTFTGTWATVQDPTVEDDIAYVAVDDVAALSGTYLQPVEFRDVNVALIGADDCIR